MVGSTMLTYNGVSTQYAPHLLSALSLSFVHHFPQSFHPRRDVPLTVAGQKHEKKSPERQHTKSGMKRMSETAQERILMTGRLVDPPTPQPEKEKKMEGCGQRYGTESAEGEEMREQRCRSRSNA